MKVPAPQTSLRPLRALRPLCALPLCALWLCLACGGEPREAKELGRLPDAVTTAVPEWLPFRVMAGESVPADEREKRLGSLRRLTEGCEVSDLAWLPGGRALLVVMRAPGDAGPRLYRLELVASAPAPRALTEPGVVVQAVTVSALGPARIVVAIARGEASTLQELDETGAVRELPAVSTTKITGLSLSADGSTLMVSSRTAEGARVDAVTMVGASASRAVLTSSALPGAGVALSDSLAQISLGTQEGVLIASDEGRVARLAKVGPVSSVAFSVAARAVLFSAVRDRQATEIYRLPLDAEFDAPPERVTFAQADHAALSPTGTHLAFGSRRFGATSDLYIAPWNDQL